MDSRLLVGDCVKLNHHSGDEGQTSLGSALVSALVSYHQHRALHPPRKDIFQCNKVVWIGKTQGWPDFLTVLPQSIRQ